MAKLVAKTYGDALFEVACEEKKEEQFLEEAKEVLYLLNLHPDFQRLMNHPKILKEEKIKMLEEVFSEKISKEIFGLMQLMITKGRFKDLNATFTYFIYAVKEARKIGTAHVSSAMELTEDQKEKIKAKLIQTTEYETFEMEFKVDPTLIGGIKIQVKDRVIDGTVATKLQDMKRELSKIQLKVGECAP